MYGYIYKITNLINGKVYIGKHKSEIFDDKYHGSGKILKISIKKYGWENFSYIQIDQANNLEELNIKEKYWINYYKSTNTFLYNIANGGDGGPTNLGVKQSSEWVRKRCDKLIGKKASEDLRRKLSIAHLGQIPWNKGLKMSADFCEKHRKSSLGNINHLGFKATDEQRKHMSNSHKGKTPWNKGLTNLPKQSEETKLKRNEKLRGCIGINNGIKNTKVKLEELDTYLALGWNKGWIKINKGEDK